MTRRVGALALVSFLLGAAALITMPGVASAATICNANPLSNTTINDDVVIPPFPAQCTMINVTVNGNVVIQPTGRFTAVNSTINGNITGTNINALTLINTTVTRSVSVIGTGSAGAFIGICNSTIRGNLLIQNANSPEGFISIGPACDPAGGNTIGGTVFLTNNRTFADAPIPGLRVANNHIGGSLVCTGNTPPASSSNNTVAGVQSGECAVSPGG